MHHPVPSLVLINASSPRGPQLRHHLSKDVSPLCLAWMVGPPQMPPVDAPNTMPLPSGSHWALGQEEAETISSLP